MDVRLCLFFLLYRFMSDSFSPVTVLFRSPPTLKSISGKAKPRRRLLPAPSSTATAVPLSASCQAALLVPTRHFCPAATEDRQRSCMHTGFATRPALSHAEFKPIYEAWLLARDSQVEETVSLGSDPSITLSSGFTCAQDLFVTVEEENIKVGKVKKAAPPPDQDKVSEEEEAPEPQPKRAKPMNPKSQLAVRFRAFIFAFKI